MTRRQGLGFLTPFRRQRIAEMEALFGTRESGSGISAFLGGFQPDAATIYYQPTQHMAQGNMGGPGMSGLDDTSQPDPAMGFLQMPQGGRIWPGTWRGMPHVGGGGQQGQGSQ